MMDPPPGSTPVFLSLEKQEREHLRDALHRLLAHGSMLRDDPGNREIYDWCRNHAEWLDNLAELLGFRLAWEHDNRMIHAIPQFPALLRRLRMDESIVVMALWYDYDTAVRDEGANEVFLTIQEFNERLGSKFNHLKLLSESRMGEILRMLARFNLVRISQDPQFARARMQILPTIRYVIPFPNIEEWNRQRERYLGTDSDGAGEDFEELDDEPAD
jgi:Domain of unknown function (DUF4194)